jgi:phosphogluconate dehydratase
MSAVSPVIARVTERIRDRSCVERSTYLTRVRAAQSRQPQRSGHACANLAHGFAAAPEADKGMLLELQPVPNFGLSRPITTYFQPTNRSAPIPRF